MMRLRLATRPSVLFAAMLVVALIVFLPMRLALGATGLADQGLSARRVGGTIWGGSLLEARFGDVALGDLRVSLSPLALLVGRARLAFEGAGADGRPIAGAATISRHAMGIDGVTASLPAAALFAPLPVTTLALEDVTVRFRDGVCEEAGGRVRATVTGEAGGLPLPPTMMGNARCEAGALLLPMTGQGGTEAVNLRIRPDGRYTADLVLSPSDPAAAAKLEQLGFVAGSGGGYRLSAQGRF
ncbi:type II secretion system protein N [Sphingomonas paucimobilis]|uniref:Type II secretion system protein N n=2 Tax=Sphingomonas paucimobilis TaxID=13689 RepID=A0A411LMN7_SPHPI|nr:type II secretion system protein N [Sphingomonas sp.]NNG58419.1 type II secretion system protein N [Sphingomonas paucimobilis]QBE93653.1 type II secretion system protein N [Sphingomonas paucimobilis]QPS15574.1 type II secretion system protein N [Sphingomonas paucimobilis]QPT10330.1 type II secretion system protein N [Sphingomonas paucimobilis]